jgi:hypothetical protein
MQRFTLVQSKFRAAAELARFALAGSLFLMLSRRDIGRICRDGMV